MVLAKYLACLLLMQYNTWCKPLLIASILSVEFIWNNAAKCIKVNGVKVFLYETQGLVAQDILTESLQQLYNCHNNVKSELQAKLIIIFASKHGAQINVRVKRGTSI